MDSSSNSGAVTSAKSIGGIGIQAQDYKVGDVLRLVIQGYGGINPYFDNMVLHPNDRLIEVTVSSVKKVKPQEYLEA